MIRVFTEIFSQIDKPNPTFDFMFRPSELHIGTELPYRISVPADNPTVSITFGSYAGTNDPDNLIRIETPISAAQVSAIEELLDSYSANTSVMGKISAYDPSTESVVDESDVNFVFRVSEEYSAPYFADPDGFRVLESNSHLLDLGLPSRTFVSGKSEVLVAYDYGNHGVGQHGATIIGVKVEWPGNQDVWYRESALTGGIVRTLYAKSGNTYVDVFLQDSRGFIGKTQIPIAAMEYHAPRIADVRIGRSGTDGTAVSISVMGAITPITVDGTLYNGRVQSCTFDGHAIPVTTADGEYVATADPISGLTVPIGETLTGNLIVWDAVSSTTMSVEINSGIPVISVREGKVGINNQNPEKELDVHGQIKLETASGSAFVQAARTGGKTVSMGVGSSGTNHGLYSNTHSKWIVYADNNGDVKLPVKNSPSTTTASTEFIPVLDSDSGDNTIGTNDGLRYQNRAPSGTTNGYGSLILGNATDATTAGGKYGSLRMYGNGSNYTLLRAQDSTANQTINLPNASGTLTLGEADEGYIVIGGMQICWGKLTAAMGSTSGSGTHYYSNATSITGGTFAKAFATAPPSVLLTASTATSTIIQLDVASVSATGITDVRVHRISSSTGYNAGMYFVAFGAAQ